MEDIGRGIRDFFNGWLIDHIKGILLSCVIASVAWVLGRPFLANGSYYESARATAVSIINVIWAVDIGFTIVATVNFIFHIFYEVFQQIRDWLRRQFRGF